MSIHEYPRYCDLGIIRGLLLLLKVITDDFHSEAPRQVLGWSLQPGCPEKLLVCAANGCAKVFFKRSLSLGKAWPWVILNNWKKVFYQFHEELRKDESWESGKVFFNFLLFGAITVDAGAGGQRPALLEVQHRCLLRVGAAMAKLCWNKAVCGCTLQSGSAVLNCCY